MPAARRTERIARRRRRPPAAPAGSLPSAQAQRAWPVSSSKPRASPPARTRSASRPCHSASCSAASSTIQASSGTPARTRRTRCFDAPSSPKTRIACTGASRSGGERLPGADRAQERDVAGAERVDPRVERAARRRRRCAALVRDQSHREAARGARQARAHRAAADDDQVVARTRFIIAILAVAN